MLIVLFTSSLIEKQTTNTTIVELIHQNIAINPLMNIKYGWYHIMLPLKDYIEGKGQNQSK